MSQTFGTNQVGSICVPCPGTAQDWIHANPDTDDLLDHWIEIELVGEDDAPIPREHYCITLPDGVEVHGYLDSHGRARVVGIESGGDCKITFPDLDGRIWEAA
jgi:hypothetical protein